MMVQGQHTEDAREPKTAAEYRHTADEHVQTLKDFWKNFLVSGLFVVAAIVIIFACLAWFFNNSQVTATGASVSAQGEKFTLEPEGMGAEGSHVGYYERTEAEKANLGNLDITDSMTVTLNSNLNNNDDGSIYPGARGVITFTVVPLSKNLGDVEIDLSRVLKTNIDADTEGAPEANALLLKLVKSHVLFFRDNTAEDGGGFYSARITDSFTIGSSEFRKKNADGSTASNDTTEAVTVHLYWVWPEYLQNFVLTGNALYYKNLFANAGDDKSDYGKLQAAVNGNKTAFYYGSSSVTSGGVTTTTSAANAPDLASGMGAGAIATCAELYNNADEYIGNNVEYLQLRISAQEVS